MSNKFNKKLNKLNSKLNECSNNACSDGTFTTKQRINAILTCLNETKPQHTKQNKTMKKQGNKSDKLDNCLAQKIPDYQKKNKLRNNCEQKNCATIKKAINNTINKFYLKTVSLNSKQRNNKHKNTNN